MEDIKELGGGDADAVFLDSKNPALSRHCLQYATAEVNKSSKQIENIKYYYPKEYGGTVREAKSSTDVESLIRLLEYNRDAGPNGMILDKTKVSPEGIKAIKASKEVSMEGVKSNKENVLGYGITSKIVVVKDIKLGEENAMKTVMLAQFHRDQITAWCLLGDQGLAPKLHSFHQDGNKVVKLMEIMEGKTLKDVLDSELLNNPDHSVSLSFCVLEGLLTAFEALKANNFTHGDMHAGNVMIELEKTDNHPPQIKIKVFDFDMARRLLQESAKEGLQRIKNDLLEIIRMFCQLYSGYDLVNRYEAEKLLKEKRLKEVSEMLRQDLKEEQRQELLTILTMLIDCVSDPRQEKYGDTSQVSTYINKKYPIETIKKQIAVILFPERFQHQAVEVCDTAGMECELDFLSVWDDPDLDDFVKNVTDKDLRDLGVILLT